MKVSDLRRRTGVVAGLAASVVLVVGCQSANERFRGQLIPLQTSIEATKAQLAATLRQSRRHRQSDVLLLNQEIDAMASSFQKIAKLEAPSQASGAFKAYNAAGQGLVAALRRFAQVLGSGSNRALTEAGAQSRDAAGALSRANDALQAAVHG
ncbi:MAG TPA: hypothetical protein VGN69_02455 [Solirubrobacteraceae bacterium]|jgi:hypothetical protein|nr:hypothetical protein [Solirubrobacteraceae bacterium]